MPSHLPTLSNVQNDQRLFQQALTGFQATAANFAATCIQDSRVRQQYMLDIGAASAEFKSAVLTGRMTAKDAAIEVNRVRNDILELSRLRSSPVGRTYATKMKKNGLTIDILKEKYAQRSFRKPFNALTESQQSHVYAEIVSAGGRGRTAVVELAEKLGRVGKRLVLVSLAVAAYDVYESEDKPREIARQGTLAAAGVAGGWAVGTGAVATGICAATAPVCVGIAAFIGGLLFAFGSDLVLDTVYPNPAIRSRP